ncbi:hypothetical protein LUZ60_007251 [Juncus effusus]|nr:hypothetical protein LUZ60_007251 [Juncus effusus]
MAGASNSASLSMKEYLKRYQSGTDAEDPNKKKKKKKKEKKKPAAVGGVLVVDEDPVWQKPVQIEEQEESDSGGEEQPLVEEDIEVRRMKRLEALRAKHNQISEDGSGWISVPISHPQNPSSDDLFPPRQHRKRLDTPDDDDLSPPSRRNDADLSPPRQRGRRIDTPSPDRHASRRDAELAPSRRDEDLSPPRQRRRRADTPSPDRSSRRDDADLSPPRQRRRRAETPSPSRSDADMSPPRRKRHDSVSTNDLSPPRRRTRHDSVSTNDLSPPRRRTRHDSVSTNDLSPPRRKQHDSVETADMSPPRRRKSRFDSEERDDVAPARREKQKERAEVAERGKEVAKRSGFFTKEEIEEEIKKKKDQEIARILLMDASVSGKGAEVVYRDKRGQRISKEDMLKAKEQEKPKEEKPIAWGKGLAQKREAEAKFLEMEQEKNKPFARSRDDPELDKMLKEAVRWGDPMAHLAKKKNMEPILEDLGDDERMKESGFIIPQGIPNHSWLKRGIDYPPNRYGIKPGRHWDGVDRSTGFEKDLFKRQNEKRATEQEAYLWSVSDM